MRFVAWAFDNDWHSHLSGRIALGFVGEGCDVEICRAVATALLSAVSPGASLRSWPMVDLRRSANAMAKCWDDYTIKVLSLCSTA